MFGHVARSCVQNKRPTSPSSKIDSTPELEGLSEMSFDTYDIYSTPMWLSTPSNETFRDVKESPLSTDTTWPEISASFLSGSLGSVEPQMRLNEPQYSPLRIPDITIPVSNALPSASSLTGWDERSSVSSTQGFGHNMSHQYFNNISGTSHLHTTGQNEDRCSGLLYGHQQQLDFPYPPGFPFQHFDDGLSIAGFLGTTDPPDRGEQSFQHRSYGSSYQHDMETKDNNMARIQEFKDVPKRFGGLFIPQRMYKPQSETVYKRYVDDQCLLPPIYFSTADGVITGVSLEDAFTDGASGNLNKSDEPVLHNSEQWISIRLEWPGYRPWSRQIRTRDYKKASGPITRGKLVKDVAKCIQRFMKDQEGSSLEDDSDLRYRVRDGAVKLSDLTLISLHHVSKGSWQPQLKFRKELY